MKRSKILSDEFTSIIDALPDLVLVEIFCRLPFESTVPCKLVSKRWSTVLSDPYFVRRFLSIQRELHRPIFSTLLFTRKFKYAFLPKLSTRNFSLNLLLPTCSQEKEKDPQSQKGFGVAREKYDQKPQMSRGVVVGTYNDLVLFCQSWEYQRDYFICNPYTKHCVALPPTPCVYRTVHVGFICEPYYKEQQKTNSVEFILSADYRCRVVRLLPDFDMEIFSSETGEWIESAHELGPPEAMKFFSPGIACNGMLYWLCETVERGYFIFELDVFSCDTSNEIIDKCRFIDGPNFHDGLPRFYYPWIRLGVSGRCLRVTKSLYNHHDNNIKIWEWREGADEEAGGKLKLKWHLIVEGVSLQEMVCNSKDPSINEFKELDDKFVRAFHPNNEDIMYLDFNGKITICNLRARTLEVVTQARLESLVTTKFSIVALGEIGSVQ